MNMSSYKCCATKNELSTNIEETAKLLKLLGEPNRLRIMCALNNDSEHCVCEFEDHMPGISQSLLSHHLADLKDAGLVMSEKRGQRAYYRHTSYGKSAIKQTLNIKKEEII
ncbi:ArsR family transcriptional regulator [Candidatus Saccharibacteria bacterium]|nr:ArsR family transcriptional regulator [Candidatus Saccharibacteria bacterium]NCU40530.1 ArsR family transcriptional regulator [Candidatus Saccharibacteria bacterium]